MKKVIVLAIALVSMSAFAHTKDASRLSCGRLQAKVKANGWADITVNGKTHTYVANYNGEDCFTEGDQTFAAWIKTRDNDKCFVGYLCSDDNNGTDSVTDFGFDDADVGH